MLRLRIDDFSLPAIAESGQCFRMLPAADEDGAYDVLSGSRYLRIRDHQDGSFSVSCSREEWESYYVRYFDLEADYGIYRACCMPEDSFLRRCIAYGSGIRVLNQDRFEMLISFLISQRKSVPAIRTIIRKLSALAGEEIVNEYGCFYAFPAPEALAALSMEEIRTTGAGYRCGYILQAAESVRNGELDLTAMEILPDAELLQRLMEVRGAGIKVASCAALFGFHRIAVCPQDVWMNRILQEVYHGSWPEAYAPVLGILQQYMFHYARLNKDKIY